jgi:two-component system nitrate/nitrite response regulator NarL
VLFAEAIALALEDAGMSVAGVATTGEQAIALVERSMPDVILMDLALPDQSGFAVGRAILERWPDARILALTALSDTSAVGEALRIGFRGYLTKDIPVAGFVSSVRLVLNGGVALGRAVASRARKEDEDVALLASQLTRREWEVLALLVQGASGAAIASDLGISPNTVRTHVQSILTKLQVHSRLEAVSFAVRHGLLTSEEGRARLVG